MSLRDLIRGTARSRPATAIPATIATDRTSATLTVARVATVAVASPPNAGPGAGPTWDATDWRAYHDERAAIREYDGAMSRAEAEALAIEDCVVAWLDHDHAATPAGVCAHCGHDGRHETVLSYGTERAGHAWLHGRCWPAWYDEKKQRAREALARMGIPAHGAASHGKD